VRRKRRLANLDNDGIAQGILKELFIHFSEVAMAHLENLALQRPVKTQIWLGTSCNDDLRSQLKFANVQLTLVSSLQDVLSRNLKDM